MDIGNIINGKIAAMNEEGAIEKAIADSTEKAILKVVEDVFSRWDLKRALSEKMGAEVDKSVAGIDFSTYNGFIVSTITNLFQNVMREDIIKRTEKTISALFLCDRKEVKLSDIFEAYRKMVCEREDEHEKYDRQHFHASLEDDGGHWRKVQLHPERLEKRSYGRDTPEIEFRVLRSYKGDGTGTVHMVRLNGVSLGDKLKIGHLNDVELMLVQAAYNDISVIIDVDSEDDIDDSYDIDI